MTDDLPQLTATTVIADRFPDGTYGATVSVGEDLSWTMPGPRARRYALALIEAATACEHDAALYGSLTARGIPEDMTAEVILQCRAARDPSRWTRPLLLVSILTAAEPHRPILRVHPELPTRIDGWQWTPDEVRRHARQVLEAVTAAEEDNRLAYVLTGAFGLEESVVAAVIDSLKGFWPEAPEKDRA